MGLASSLSTALTGLQASETVIDVTGNNLANANTVGFKASHAQFATQFLQTLSLGSAPTESSGGTNPRQTGLGTQVAEISPDFTQGTIELSTNPYDLAIQGDGFFIVEGNAGEQFYTRTGKFKTNSNNELVTITGHRLLGHGVDDDFQVITTELTPLTVPLGATSVAQATKNVFLEGTLRPNGDVANQAEVIQSAVLGDAIAPRADDSLTGSAALIPDAAATTATSATTGGASLVPGETYRYRFAFVDAAGKESLASEASVPPGSSPSVTVAAGQNSITLNSIPEDTSTSGAYPTVRIYRTTNGGTSYFLAGSVPNGTTTYTDGAADGSLGAALNEDRISGSYSYYITYYKAGEEESRPSEISGPFNISDNRIHLANLPSAPPPVPPGGGFPAYDRIRIYRNLASDLGSFYLVDTIPFGQDYTDSKSDISISTGTSAKQLDTDGPRIAPNTLLTNVLLQSGTTNNLSYTSPFEEGTLSFKARKGGRDLETQPFTITDTSTVQDLIDFMTASMGIQLSTADPNNPIPPSDNNLPDEFSSTTASLSAGATIDNGRIRFVGNNGEANAIDITIGSFTLTPTAGPTSTPNLQFGSIQAAVGESAVTDFIVYDSLGIPVNVRLTAIQEAVDGTSTTYRWFADSSDNDPTAGTNIAVGTGLIRFDGEGNVIEVTEDTIAVRRDNIPSLSPLEFKLDFSAMSGLSDTKSSLAAARQDGSSAGTLSSFIIGEDGRVRGVFSNGVSRDLGQVRMARFANPAGLEQQGQNLFASGVNSGLAVEADPGEQGIGSIRAGAVELSNTDVGKNLIDLILASTTYRSNTRVITTAQQLLDELLNLRR